MLTLQDIEPFVTLTCFKKLVIRRTRSCVSNLFPRVSPSQKLKHRSFPMDQTLVLPHITGGISKQSEMKLGNLFGN